MLSARFHCSLWISLSLMATAALAQSDSASESALAEVIVTATLRPTASIDVPASVTVIDRETLKDAGLQHLQDVLPLVPNLNWASGSSRPRYFQLRGIGETDQWQGAPNPSVGFLIDGLASEKRSTERLLGNFDMNPDPPIGGGCIGPIPPGGPEGCTHPGVG